MLQYQFNLRDLDLSEGFFNDDQTDRLLETIIEAEMFGSLTTLNLFESLDLDSLDTDKSVKLLAQLLATAPNLKLVDITVNTVY